MEKLTLLSLSFFLALSSFAQDTLMIYYDDAWKETTKDNAQYQRKKFKTGEGWAVIDYYHSGKIQMKGVYADDSCHLQNGLFTWYFEKEGISQLTNYRNGKEEGLQILYYEDGGKKIEGNNILGKQEGEWIGYYPDGKVSARVQFKENKQVSGNFYLENGKPNKDITQFFRAAEYPGGMTAFGRYLYHTLVYPLQAQKKGIGGSVVVGFMVRKDGVLTNFKIEKSVEASLDAEALRVIKQMPLWTPCISGGVLTDYYFKQPVTFKLE